MKLTAIASLLSLALVSPTNAATYRRVVNAVGNEFYNHFQFWSQPDPTHGRVNYVDRNTAQSQGLVSASGSNFIMRADSKTVLNANGPGRNSIRLRSNQMYTTHVAIFDIQHMPAGCGTWPAIWTTDDNPGRWPYSGEIDILEGVNDVSPNKVTLHTTPGCVMQSGNTAQTGTSTQLDCDSNVNSNTGCGVNINEGPNYGPAFNNAGGGWYALERTNDAIRVWFWPRNSNKVPSGVRNGDGSVETSGWGTPSAHFRSSSSCNIASKFSPNYLIINLTFCGDWAGQKSLYNQAGCPGECVDHVNRNPGAFSQAYFDFKAVRIYTP